MAVPHIYRLDQIGAEDEARILRRSELDISDIAPAVQEIIADVRRRGDAALIDYTARFDRVTLDPRRLRVGEDEFQAAERQIEPGVRDAIAHAVRNLRRLHEQQLPPEQTWVTVEPGVLAGEKVTPIASAGLYVPRGKGSFPSVVMMLSVPSVTAGVPRIVMVTPPDPQGQVDVATLVAARLCGVTEIYRVGGPQAVAALAYGTESIPAVRKVVGPGSSYVTAAKRLLYGVIDVGLPAGPSEAIVLADATADARLVAVDLLVEAEHGLDSAALLVTDSQDLASAVQDLLPALIAELPEPRRQFCERVMSNYGGIILCPSLHEAVAFVNKYAPEHLQVLTADPLGLLPEIVHAGEILLGAYAPIPIGNFVLGTNAVLPTGGFATTFSAASAHEFSRLSGIPYVTAGGFRSVGPVAATLADYEGFPAHARAVRARSS